MNRRPPGGIIDAEGRPVPAVGEIGTKNMKQDPHDREIADRLASGVLSREGFLGTDPRPLGEILDADRSAVEALGASHERIAAAMKRAADEAMHAQGVPVEVSTGVQAVYREAMGQIPCPWGGGQRFPKGQIDLTDARTGETLSFSPLSVHLVGAHGFYEGRGALYRIEPEALCRLLGVASGSGSEPEP